MTLGHNRVRQSMVFRDMEAWSAEAETSQGARTFLLIGELNSPGLIEDISRFAKDLRGAARQPGIAGELSPEIPASIPAGLLGKLRDYFDEPSGERKIKAREQAVADCYHGAVVHALRATFKDSSVLKSREIDLTAFSSRSKHRPLRNTFTLQLANSSHMQRSLRITPNACLSPR